MTKFMTWTLHAPSTAVFSSYYKLPEQEPWYSKNYVLVDKNGMANWDYRKRSFVEMIEKYSKKFYAIGMHQFGVTAEGKIFNMGFGGEAYSSLVLNNYKTSTPSAPTASVVQTTGTSGNAILENIDQYTGYSGKFYIRRYNTLTYMLSRNGSGNDEVPIDVVNGITYVDGIKITLPAGRQIGDKWTITATENTLQPMVVRPVQTSLRYLMHTYPEIKWSIQYLATKERVNSVLWNENGAQDVFIEEIFNITKDYRDKGFPIRGVEIDFEKTSSTTISKGDDHITFKNLLVRIKNEVCIPLGMELRVNLFAMTDDMTPAYYSWHDYATLASGVDKNGNQAIDEFQTMSYDFSWGGSAPGPSTPLWWLQQTLEHVKKLGKNGILDPKKVFIGNAGYGRRWPLGEWDAANNRDRYGSTMDYKQLMIAQNGGYIHNPGDNTIYNGENAFWFNDQDFIPIAGFNDEESSYQRTYLNVYDRFKLTENGGAKYDAVNFGDNYATNYSRRQYPIFSGIVASDFGGEDNFESTKLGNGEGDKIARINTAGTDTLYVAGRTTGLNLSSCQYGYSPRLSTGVAPSVDGKVNYDLYATGTYRLIALVHFPFFNQSALTWKLNGVDKGLISYKGQEWYPFMQPQERHFLDLGTHTFNGNNTIEVGAVAENGAQIWGFVVCSSFDYNIQGGKITFPSTIQPMKRRGPQPADGEITLVNAQYPDFMRIVGEVLTRPPRPAIIWEDMFTSYVTSETEPAVPTGDGFGYYTLNSSTKNPGYSIGSWKIIPETEDDYQCNYCDSLTQSSQFMLNHAFGGNIAVDIELRGDARDTNAVYGIRALATSKSGGSGYACLLDFGKETVTIVYEDTGAVVGTKAMSANLKKLNGQRIRLRVYVLGDKISLWIEKEAYFDRLTMPVVPSSGAYGVYCRNVRLKLYKYNISSLDRYERMERLEITTGGTTYNWGSVPRNATIDEYGLISFTGYPAEIASKIATPGEDGEVVDPNATVAGTIIDTQVDKNFAWSNDYRNKALAIVPSWQGKQDVTIRFRDAGIWFRNFYVGDDQGMSVAYNSDRIGFIKTANFVNSYGCKGIAMWTLGQEDPTIYPYISG